MIWIDKNDYYTESQCRRYTVSTSYHDGKPKFTAWRIGGCLTKGDRMLGIFSNSDGNGRDNAKERCELHSQAQA